MSKKAMRRAAVWKLLEEGFYWVDGEGWQKPVFGQHGEAS